MKKDKTMLRWKLIEFPLKGLIEWDSNPVRISKRDLNELAKSIKRFNQDLPYVAAEPPGKSKKIPLLDGHQRKRAEVEINKKSIDDIVPVLVPNRALTESEKKEWVIRHRKNTGQFDFDILKEKFLAVNLMEWGFEQKDLKLIGFEFGNESQDSEPQIDRAEELQEKWKVKVGDLFAVGEHRLLCGDSTKREGVERVMGVEKINMIFTDPPYGVNYGHDQDELQKMSGGKFSKRRGNSKIENDDMSAEEIAEKVWSPAFANMYNAAADDCSFYMTMCQGGDQMMMMMMMMMAQSWKIKHELIWVKNAPVFSMGRLDYDYQHEPILFGWKKKHVFFAKGKFTKSVWEINKPASSIEHPTMKPVELVENALLNSSDDGWIVYDAFSGSGTTLVACQNLGRRGRAIEIAPKYVAVALERMATAFPRLEIKRINKNEVQKSRKKAGRAARQASSDGRQKHTLQTKRS